MLPRVYMPFSATHYKRLILFITILGIIVLIPLSSGRLLSTSLQGIGTTTVVPQKLPLSFEPNMGQTDASVRYMAHASGGTLFFNESKVVLSLNAASSQKQAARLADNASSKQKKDTDASVLSIEFIGANPDARLGNGAALPGKVNYISGNDPTAWQRNVSTYASINYDNLYPGVTLDYSGTGGHLKGTYTVSPHGEPSQIRWRYGGARSVTLDAEGNLLVALPITSSAGDAAGRSVTEHAPVAWQEINGERVPVSAGYSIEANGTVGFQLGAYDRSEPLTIDPTITYATYLGGFYGDSAGSIWLDAAGNIYVGGTTSSSDFPIAGNPYQPVYGGGNYDMFASKLSPDGSSLIYSTFVGGDDWDIGALAGVDPAGVATLGGWTTSENFPTTPGAYQNFFAGTEDVALARLSADGSDLIFGSYWGDEAVDEPYGFAVDGAGNTYFTGYFFPGHSSWAFVAALSPDGTQQLFRRDLGGSMPGPGDENANSSGEGIVVDGSGNIYVTGYTRAADFPTTPGAYRRTIQAFEDGFMAKLSPMAQSIIYSTYIPGGVSDYPYDIAIDQGGNAYITGNTSSSDYPTTQGAFQENCGDPRCAFITKLNPAGSALVYSSFLGGPQFHFETEDYGLAVRVNQSGNAYVVGYTSADDFPVVNAIQSTLRGPFDGFLTKFNVSGSGVEYSTYLGGTAGDFIDGITLDEMGHVYLAGSTGSTDFPVVNPLQPGNRGQDDGFVAVIAEEGAVTPTATAVGTGTPATASPTPDPCGGLTPWRTETPMPIAHGNSASAVLDNQLYVIAGASNSPTPVRYTQRFDVQSSSWTNKAVYPDGVGLAFSQAAAVAGKIYTIGDTYQPGESFIEMYDPVADTWSRRATLPDPLISGALAAYSGKIYIMGGQVPGQLPASSVYEYDPVADTITARAPMPTGQAEIGAAVVGNRIYVVGGYQYIHYAYDPVANTWSSIATPPTPSFSVPGVFSFNGELWVTTGRDNITRRGYPPNQEIQIYNPTTNQWRYGPALNVPRYYSTAVGVINGRAYIVGGIDLDSETYPLDYLSSMESISYQGCGTLTPQPTGTAVTTIQPTSTTPITSSPQPSQTGQPTPPSTLTSTPAASGTPTAIATTTMCNITFSDVPAGDTFYTNIRCLACRGIISGYSDGTFRPGNDVTRGQLSKIVANAAGFSEPVGGQTFADVPPTNTFYEYIERMASRNIISGYADGTFRPGNNATRGQISKIVANAAGLSEPVSGQTFSDVPPSHTFYEYIERMARRGIISGYSDGTFRPQNNATRGQSSKIVANTFFPECNPANPARP